MDEPAKKPDLSLEQQNTAALIRQLLGKSMADRYVDFCRLASGALPLRVSIPLAAHALRELESVLRQTLAGPMEIATDTTQDDLARVGAARKHLHAAGFNEDTINRAVKELLPRLSHKAQIQAIVTRLGLAADGDLARAWTAISQAHGKAHGRALYQSLAVDAEFRTRWQAPFDTVMRGLMIALQGKYAALMQRVDQLAAMPDRGAAVTSFVKEIPGALPLLWHFFNQLQTPDWLPHLAKHNLLAAPTLPPDEDAEGEGLLSLRREQFSIDRETMNVVDRRFTFSGEIARAVKPGEAIPRTAFQGDYFKDISGIIWSRSTIGNFSSFNHDIVYVHNQKADRPILRGWERARILPAPGSKCAPCSSPRWFCRPYSARYS